MVGFVFQNLLVSKKETDVFRNIFLFLDTLSNREFFNALSLDFLALGHELCFHQKPYLLLIEA